MSVMIDLNEKDNIIYWKEMIRRKRQKGL